MIVLDTDVLSVFVRQRPDPAVVQWLNQQDPSEISSTVITVFEIRRGLSLLPIGARRYRLETLFVGSIGRFLQNRILPLDHDAAEHASKVSAARQLIGINIGLSDTLIAGIAIRNQAQIATRNERHFSDLDLTVINPWREITG